MTAPDDRWYKGVRHCVIVQYFKKEDGVTEYRIRRNVKVQWDDGTFDIVPVRLCHRWKKES